MEVWLKVDEIPSVTERARFDALGNVSVHSLADVAAAFPEVGRQLYPENWGDKPYIAKQLALVSASCTECLLIDADNVPTRDPTFLFDDAHLARAAVLLWPDFWRTRTGPVGIRGIFSLSSTGVLEDARTVESGQVVADKRRAWAALLFAVHLQV